MSKFPAGTPVRVEAKYIQTTAEFVGMTVLDPAPFMGKEVETLVCRMPTIKRQVMHDDTVVRVPGIGDRVIDDTLVFKTIADGTKVAVVSKDGTKSVTGVVLPPIGPVNGKRLTEISEYETGNYFPSGLPTTHVLVRLYDGTDHIVPLSQVKELPVEDTQKKERLIKFKALPVGTVVRVYGGLFNSDKVGGKKVSGELTGLTTIARTEESRLGLYYGGPAVKTGADGVPYKTGLRFYGALPKSANDAEAMKIDLPSALPQNVSCHSTCETNYTDLWVPDWSNPKNYPTFCIIGSYAEGGKGPFTSIHRIDLDVAAARMLAFKTLHAATIAELNDLYGGVDDTTRYGFVRTPTDRT